MALTMAAAAVCLAPIAPAQAALPRTASIWYVSGVGSDAHDGASAQSAFRTVSRAIETARPGDTISLLSGTYAPFAVTIPSITISATAQAQVVGTPKFRDVVLVEASNVTIRGLNISGCIPNPRPDDGFGHGASSGIRVAPGANGVLLDHLTVHDSHGVNLQGQPFGCHGIALQHTTGDTVTNSNVYHNGEGIWVDGGGSGTVIAGNTVHDNDVLIVDTPSPSNDDWGAVGIGVTDASGVTIRGNTVYNNNGRSHDWGYDGGAFEIYQSSHVSITRNTAFNNNDVLETGANGTSDCTGNTFANNVVSGRTRGSSVKVSSGLILRCAHGMTITANRISDVDWWTFWIYQRKANGRDGGTISGLTIKGNTVIQDGAQVYALGALPNPTSITIERNSYTYRGRFATVGRIGSLSFTQWRTKTGFEHTTRPNA